MLRVRVLRVLDQLRQQNIRVEDVNPHRHIDHIFVPGRPDLRLLRLLVEADDLPVLRHLHHAERRDLVGMDRQGCQRHIGTGVLMLLQHQPIVHLVDVVARQNEDVLWLLRPDRIDILIDRVRRALVPALRNALHGRQNLDELAQLIRHYGPPSLADVPVQRERLVLGQDVHMPQVGVDAVRKCDVDNAVLPCERNGRLGAIAG